jgi:hypothetical protein
MIVGLLVLDFTIFWYIHPYNFWKKFPCVGACTLQMNSWPCAAIGENLSVRALRYTWIQGIGCSCLDIAILIRMRIFFASWHPRTSRSSCLFLILLFFYLNGDCCKINFFENAVGSCLADTVRYLANRSSTFSYAYKIVPCY